VKTAKEQLAKAASDLSSSATDRRIPLSIYIDTANQPWSEAAVPRRVLSPEDHSSNAQWVVRDEPHKDTGSAESFRRPSWPAATSWWRHDEVTVHKAFVDRPTDRPLKLPLDDLVFRCIIKPRSHRPTRLNSTKQFCWVESRRAMWSRLKTGL